MHAVTSEITVERSLPIHNEVSDGTVEQGYDESQYQIGEVRNHSSSLAICLRLPIRRRT